MQWFRRTFVLASGLGLLWTAWSFRAGNADVIDVDLVFARLPGVALWQALSLFLASGLLIGGLVAGLGWVRQRLLNRRYRKAIEKLESEVHQLRSLPLSGSVRAETDESVVRGRAGSVA